MFSSRPIWWCIANILTWILGFTGFDGVNSLPGDKHKIRKRKWKSSTFFCRITKPLFTHSCCFVGALHSAKSEKGSPHSVSQYRLLLLSGISSDEPQRLLQSGMFNVCLPTKAKDYWIKKNISCWPWDVCETYMQLIVHATLFWYSQASWLTQRLRK